MKQENLREYIQAQLLESANVKQLTSQTCTDSILIAAETIINSFKAGGKLMLCGNGGSAADCQHLAAEFVSSLTEGLRYPGLPAIALNTDTSCLTATGNDFGFEHIFEVQVKSLGKEGDVLLSISTSGNSENIIRAVKAAKEREIKTIGFLGRGGGTLRELVDLAILVPNEKTMRIQENHITIGHIICSLVDKTFHPDKKEEQWSFGQRVHYV